MDDTFSGDEPQVPEVTVTGLIVASVLYVSASALGDPGYVGYVIDDETGEPVPDAKITVYYRRYSSRWYSSGGITSLYAKNRVMI